MTQEEIREKIWQLEALELEHRIKVLTEYHNPWKKINYYPELKSLREQCVHKWVFTNFGPLGHAQYRCGRCHLLKVEKE